jgi:hypothetical protein
MASRIEIVQRIEDHVELLEPVHVELGILDVRMVCLELCAGLELVRNFLCNLEAPPTDVRPSHLSRDWERAHFARMK